MNFIKTTLFKNLSAAFLANLVGLAGSIILSLVLPRFIGVTQFAYYQLYIFYISYIGLLGFGWQDGIFLRYGGRYYNKIDKRLFSAQFRAFSIFETFLSIIIFVITLLNFSSFEKEFVYACCCICIVIFMPRAILHQLLQSTGRIKEYAHSLIIEKLIHVIITIIGLFIGRGDFEWFIISELIGRFSATLYIFYVCKDIIKTKPYTIIKIIPEIKTNIICGIALMVSNIASMFIVGAVRQAIVMTWDIDTFGKISLTLAISNLLLGFINSIAMVLFPMLKRIDKDNLKILYSKIRSLLMVVTFFALLFYLPIRKIFSLWLPAYADSFKYMAMLFPMIVFESKMALLLNTYMKALRLERRLLNINLISVSISIILAYISCIVLHALDYAIISIVIVLIVRCIIAEFILKKYIEINIYKNILWEICLTIVFITGSWFISGITGFILYLLFYMSFVLLNIKNLYKIKNEFQNNVPKI